MKCQRFFLLLTLIPTLVFGISEKKCNSIHNEMLSRWNRHVELIEQFNQLGFHEKKKGLELLYQSMECCHQAYQDCQKILNEILSKSKKSKLKRNDFWCIRMKALCEQDKEQIKNEINRLQVLIRQVEEQLLAWEKEVNAAKETSQEPSSQTEEAASFFEPETVVEIEDGQELFIEPREVVSLVEQEVDDHPVSQVQSVVADEKEDESLVSLVLDSIDTTNGSFSINEMDLVLPDFFSLTVRRNYSSQKPLMGNLGYGWKLSMNPSLIQQGEKKLLAEANGTVIVYYFHSKNQRWEVSPEDNQNLDHFKEPGSENSNPFHSYIENDVLFGVDGSKRFFKNGLLQKWVNPQGSTLNYFYEDERLSRIENDYGDFCGFSYNSEDNISEIYVKDGRKVSYEYNTQGDLVKVSRPDSGIVIYEYDESHRMIREIKPCGEVLENIYDDKGRVIEQRAPRGPEQEMMPTATFDYVDDVMTVIDSLGTKTVYKIIDPFGKIFL
ncbi:MAG: DUF6531 domain-containing protein [Chlamydiales bacterium]|nr:DUF6531 domain-containing protein [Chlamydiales bacterium]